MKQNDKITTSYAGNNNIMETFLSLSDFLFQLKIFSTEDLQQNYTVHPQCKKKNKQKRNEKKAQVIIIGIITGESLLDTTKAASGLFGQTP